jgi:hypothetical protein
MPSSPDCSPLKPSIEFPKQAIWHPFSLRALRLCVKKMSRKEREEREEREWNEQLKTTWYVGFTL